MGSKSFRVIGNVNNESNLTELNATDAVNNGFIDHADWLAHVARYTVVMDKMKHGHYQSILDVGCGKFPLLTYLWRNRVPLAGLTYTGLDLRAQQMWLDLKLPDTPDIELIQMNIVTDSPVSVKQAEMVVCTEMLEHIPKELAPELMKRLFNWTATGGTMILSSPNLGGSDTVAENHTAPDGTPREWTYEGKRSLLIRAGFTILDSMGTFIKLDRIPKSFWNEYTETIKNRLPNTFFRVFAAAAFPQWSNNAAFICTK